jgi:translation initiation factor IF-3
MEVIGKIKVINDTIKVSEKFSKREFVITTEDLYPQDVQFQLTQDKCTLLDMFKTGDNVKVSFNLRGREWISPQGEIKYFNTLEVWKIFKEDTIEQKPKLGGIEQNFVEEHLNDLVNEQEDDLPF